LTVILLRAKGHRNARSPGHDAAGDVLNTPGPDPAFACRRRSRQDHANRGHQVGWLATIDSDFEAGRGGAMRLRDGRYECTLCGAVLDVPTDQEPQVVIKAKSGSPNFRVIIYKGVEIHACPIGGTRQS
jgi:hypothetical protein